MRHCLEIVALIIALTLPVTPCSAQEALFNSAVKTVLQYFDDNANYAFESPPQKWRTFHPDYASPGSESLRMVIVKKPVEVVGTKWIKGDYNYTNWSSPDLMDTLIRHSRLRFGGISTYHLPHENATTAFYAQSFFATLA